MPDFQKSIDVDAPRQKVVDYISNVENMPQYLPSVTEAKKEDSDHVHMAVNINGQHHEDSGFYRENEDGSLSWGSEDHDYHGEMSFQGDDNRTTITLHLHMNPPPDLDKRMEQNSGGNWESKIDEGITRALDSIKNFVEGRGEAQPGHRNLM